MHERQKKTKQVPKKCSRGGEGIRKAAAVRLSAHVHRHLARLVVIVEPALVHVDAVRHLDETILPNNKVTRDTTTWNMTCNGQWRCTAMLLHALITHTHRNAVAAVAVATIPKQFKDRNVAATLPLPGLSCATKLKSHSDMTSACPHVHVLAAAHRTPVSLPD